MVSILAQIKCITAYIRMNIAGLHPPNIIVFLCCFVKDFLQVQNSITNNKLTIILMAGFVFLSHLFTFMLDSVSTRFFSCRGN